MHIHILGICGTFMGGIALLARELGMTVSGSDANVYPPMSTQLGEAGIRLNEGYLPQHLEPAPDLVVVGNAISRGNSALEYVLNRNLPYTSGPAFLADHILKDRWVLGVAGTHGKTTTTSLLSWILEYAGLKPGFLVGGVPANFGCSARLGDAPFFVVEADEYDTAFCDKRSKFVHYHPRTVILNNLEYDHADIFPDLAAIQRQFHHLVRTIPGNGLIIRPAGVETLDEMIAMGCWTPQQLIGSADGWQTELHSADGRHFTLYFQGKKQGEVQWSLLGQHNVDNAVAAIAAARHAGVTVAQAIAALTEFRGIKRRMEVRGRVGGITVYDDFAHHPTAIATTLDGLRKHLADGQRIVAVLEPRSNTMRLGAHQDQLAPSLAAADEVLLFNPPGLCWNCQTVVDALHAPAHAFGEIQAIIDHIIQHARADDQILIMSNGDFGDIHQKLLDQLRQARDA